MPVLKTLPAMIKAYKNGIPANGKSVSDGAVLAKIEWQKQKKHPRIGDEPHPPPSSGWLQTEKVFAALKKWIQ
jgi:hypothetical protein